MADRIQETHAGLEFYEDSGPNRIIIKRQETLANEVYLDLPTSDGTLATQEYVTANTGGSSVAGVYLASFEDRTSTETLSTLTGMTLDLDASSLYRIDIMLSVLSQGTALNSRFSVTATAGTTATVMPVPGIAIPLTTGIDSDGNALASTVAWSSGNLDITFSDDSNLRHVKAGRIVTTGSEGATIALQFAQVSSNANYERCSDAVMIATKLGDS